MCASAYMSICIVNNVERRQILYFHSVQCLGRDSLRNVKANPIIVWTHHRAYIKQFTPFLTLCIALTFQNNCCSNIYTLSFSVSRSSILHFGLLFEQFSTCIHASKISKWNTGKLNKEEKTKQQQRSHLHNLSASFVCSFIFNLNSVWFITCSRFDAVAWKFPKPQLPNIMMKMWETMCVCVYDCVLHVIWKMNGMRGFGECINFQLRNSLFRIYG